jgi:hypothetical protein
MSAFLLPDVGAVKIYEDLRDEQVLFLSDIFPDWLHGCGELQHPARATPSPSGAAVR